jgi:hypothetical protein
MFWSVLDEKIEAALPETVAETEVRFSPIETETESETTTAVTETELETTSETVPTVCEEIQPSTEEVSSVYVDTHAEVTPLAVCNDSDLMLIAKLIQSEAGYDFCSDEHQRAVASVLLNHVASTSPDFPDSVYGCIFSGWVDGGIKHYGIGSYAKFMSIVPSERAIANAQYVMTYGWTVGDAIYQAEFIPDGHEVVAVFDYGIGMPTYICR